MVIGIVAGLFALVIIIVVIVVVCYYCRHSGVVKRWNEFKLGQANTAATIASSDVRGNARSRDAWASQSSKYPLSATSVRTSPSIGKKAYSDTSSVFDGKTDPFLPTTLVLRLCKIMNGKVLCSYRYTVLNWFNFLFSCKFNSISKHD